MEKEVIKQKFNDLAVKYHKNLSSEVRGILYNLKATWDWTNEDLAYFLDTTESRIEDILSEYWDGRMSAKTFVRIHILTNGKFNMPGCVLTDESKNEIYDIIGEYQKLKFPPKTREQKIQDILDLFGVTDDEGLDKLINAIIDVRKAAYCANSDMCKEQENCKVQSSKCKVQEECKEQEECNCNNIKGKISSTYYNSSTMDKPKTVTFDLQDISETNLKKLADIWKTDITR